MGKEDGIKSSLELALEKLDHEGGKQAPLTGEQKQSLEEIERGLQAKIAEIKIMSGGKIAEARQTGDLEGADQLEKEKTAEIHRITREAERKKDKIRKSKQT